MSCPRARSPEELGPGSKARAAGLARAGGSVVGLGRSDATETRWEDATGWGRRASCQKKAWTTRSLSKA